MTGECLLPAVLVEVKPEGMCIVANCQCKKCKECNRQKPMLSPIWWGSHGRYTSMSSNTWLLHTCSCMMAL